MSLRYFLGCGYALLVEAHQQLGADLITSVDRANASIFGEGYQQPVPTEADNDAALRQLEQMMGGVG